MTLIQYRAYSDLNLLVWDFVLMLHLLGGTRTLHPQVPNHPRIQRAKPRRPVGPQVGSGDRIIFCVMFEPLVPSPDVAAAGWMEVQVRLIKYSPQGRLVLVVRECGLFSRSCTPTVSW